MNLAHIPHKKLALLSLVGCGALVILAISLFSDPGSGGAATSTSPNQFSVLEPVSAEAREALPEQAQNWLEETERSSMPGIENEELVSLGAADTDEGEVVVAGFGQNVCAYSVSYGISNCGGVNLINEGKLFVVAPDCPRSLVMGVLPDGFKTVQAASSAGVQDIPVSSNVYLSQLEASDFVLSAVAESGESFKVEAPFGNVEGSCK